MIFSQLLEHAYNLSLSSRKQNTKVGAVFVDERNNIIAEACNDYIQPLFNNIESVPEENKSFYSEHAERRLIYSTIKLGICDFGDKTLVVTHFPCCDCARAIILVGIKKLIVGNKHLNDNFLLTWGNNIKVSKQMLESNNVYIYQEGNI